MLEGPTTQKRLHENVEDWCTCGRCRVPPSFNEGDCVCCQEIAEVKPEADRQGSSCLVDSEEFEPAILNATTLYIGWMEYTDRWRRAAKAFGDRNNEKYRYVAYRKVVRWCWGWLGKDIRVQLPACVHASIMEAYPDGRGQYKGTILRRLR
ncbi:P2X purinoceptor 7-like [Strongylocentrotus purpuratus]|uniref:P2X purinoreceptor 7 intracellular domain-containing protein n=1 Tax=Strongylocentrotus purpuratus TaxID=7668 RepID=A0A7M7NM98_STRPU|nr:P2X purinoceptor 7-like [Strongylocentrotus purpuratus]